MSSSDWRLQPLKSFWQNVNWENRRLVVTTSNGSVATSTAASLSFLMPVRDYFRAISWTGIPAIAVTSLDNKLPSSQEVEESNETLEDFLDDISKFF